MRAALFWFTGVGLAVLGSVAFVSAGPKGGAAPICAARPDVAALDEAAVRRLAAKTAVTRRVVGGELTLAEAAAWFRYLDAANPPTGESSAQVDAGLSEEEQFCRQVMRWAKAQAPADGAAPEQAEALARRLEAELAALLRRDGAGPDAP
jgi:hypothetical protein